jgi:phosphohistidine phosphatase SixA
MSSSLSASTSSQEERLRFEPIEMLGDLMRNDIVLLMRHGPTDWSKLDAPDVAPTDCANQRMLSEDGREDMKNLGVLLADNGIRPGTILVSEWCRAQDTLSELVAGFSVVAPDYAASVEVETSSAANLLLSLQGAPHVTELRRRILGWQGDSRGPLLIVSHFTDIAELTQFDVYEGEILVIDPQREGRVLGYLRLASAGPDVGHFTTDSFDVRAYDGR